MEVFVGCYDEGNLVGVGGVVVVGGLVGVVVDVFFGIDCVDCFVGEVIDCVFGVCFGVGVVGGVGFGMDFVSYGGSGEKCWRVR